MDHNQTTTHAETMSRAFSSANLTYTALSTSAADKEFFHKLQSDPVSFGQSDFSLFRPQRQEQTDELLSKMIKDALLVVKICLASEQVVEDSHESKGGEDDEKQTPIGFILLTSHPAIRPHVHNTDLGISILSKYTGKGYGSEAINWAVNWAFRFGNLHRVSIGSFGYNPRALALYERLGFVKEGVTREVVWWDGRWWDGVNMGMLRRDWEELRQ
jgi:RimJ/RimL family protein N-acetyltransferase